MSLACRLIYNITASHNPSNFGATNLPAGLSLDSVTGAITGTVATAGSYAIHLTAANSAGTGTEALTLVISTDGENGGSAPIITSNLTDSGTAGQAFSYQITASNSPTGYGASGLPDGLSIDTSSGIISGTPTSGGDYSVLISASNSQGSTGSFLILSVGYTTPTITSSTTTTATAGSVFNYVITANNSPTSFSTSTLPGGLTLDAQTGFISGVPTNAGIFSITLGAHKFDWHGAWRR